jgi:hypothetical protein
MGLLYRFHTYDGVYSDIWICALPKRAIYEWVTRCGYLSCWLACYVNKSDENLIVIIVCLTGLKAPEHSDWD